MQKARIRTGWKNKERQISLEEFANAVSAICWRIALNAAKNLHQQDFEYADDYQRLGVIREYLYFFIHCADRLMFKHIDESRRAAFITTVSMDCSRHYAQNVREILSRNTGPETFIERLNHAASAMSESSFIGDAPGFDLYRYLGTRVQEIMGHSQTNKWVIDQVMQIDGPNAYEIFKSSFQKLKKNSGY